MRWLAILAILVAGASGYLLWSLSTETAPQARASQPREVEREIEPTPSGNATPAPKKVAREARPAKAEPAPTRSIDRPADTKVTTADPPAQPGTEDEVPWTDQERWQKLWTANGRYEKGNYPGAIEVAMEIARRYPPWQEDAWKVAIQAHCAMNEPEKAQALFKKMTVEPAIEEISKSCTAWGVKLTR